MYGNAVHDYRKVYESTNAGTQPTTGPAADIEQYLTKAATALDRVVPDLKQ